MFESVPGGVSGLCEAGAELRAYRDVFTASPKPSPRPETPPRVFWKFKKTKDKRQKTKNQKPKTKDNQVGTTGLAGRIQGGGKRFGGLCEAGAELRAYRDVFTVSPKPLPPSLNPPGT